MKIVTVQEMRAVEQSSVEQGVTLDQLQLNAAAAVAREVEQLFPDPEAPALFLVGPGNNGRDALIAAGILIQTGWSVRVYMAPGVGSEDVLAPLREAGAAIHRHGDAVGWGLLRSWIAEAEVVVDGLLGIGIHGTLREPMAGIVTVAGDEAASNRIPIVAVDLPSGIDADSGEVAGVALRADYTISLGCVKAGLLKFPAAEYVGSLIPVGIGLPEGICDHLRVELLTAQTVAPLIPPRPLDGHKGTFGRVLVVAGSRNFVGASYLAGAAAARSGCGLVTLAVPEWQRAALVPLLPEATYLPLRDGGGADLEENVRAIAETLEGCESLAIGPGLGQGDGVKETVLAVLEGNRRGRSIAVVVDADGLNALATVDRWWERIGPDHVVTPHPGEMSRLMGLSAAEVNANRLDVALDAARRWGQEVVLKGAFTVVASPEGDAWINPAAIPALGSGGTGDVLTGLVAGLMAQGVSTSAAARAGVYLHAAAAELTLAGSGMDRLLASDLLPFIPRAMGDLACL
jgi:ADP-dependent NAD(P)H-hydrate dehydratase / NAD(P)H-hydrate epimerase